MMKQCLLGVLYVAMLVSGTGFAGSAPEPPESLKLSPTEVLDRLAQYSGLSVDILSQFVEDEAEDFANFKDGMLALQIVDKIMNAQDADALATLVTWRFGQLADDLAKKVLPGGVVTFIAVVKIYKQALELIHTAVFVPALDNSIYQSYKAQRGGHEDYRVTTPEQAFSVASMSQGYYAVKKTIFEELVKARGLNPKVMGKKLEDKLWGEIDAYWTHRLEVRYRRELLRQKRPQIEREIENKMRAAAERIKARVGAPATIHVLDAVERKGIANAEFVLRNVKTRKRYRGRTGADGTASMLGAPAGTYRFGARAEGYEAAALEINLIPLPNQNHVRISLTPARPHAPIVATVVDRDTGQPISGCRVNFMGEKRLAMRTNGQGQARFIAPPGDWTVNADAYGYWGMVTSVWVDPAKQSEYRTTLKLQPNPQERNTPKAEADPEFEEYQYPDTAFAEEPTEPKSTSTHPADSGMKPDLDYAAEARRLQDIQAVEDWRSTTIAALRAEGNAKLDQIREALKSIAGKEIEGSCPHCGASGKQWWDGSGWTCPSCHATTMMLSEYPVAGGSYKSVREGYQRRIAAVEAAAAERRNAIAAR